MSYPSPLFVLLERIFGLMGIFVGVVMFLVAGSRAISGWGSQQWPYVQGKIVRSAILPSGTAAASSTYYKTDLVYEYSPPFHDGYTHLFHSNHITYRGFVGPEDDSYSLNEARLLTRHNPVDKPVQVYYNPRDPHQAVLRPGEDFGTYSGSLIGLIAAFIGILFLVFADAINDKLLSLFRW